MSLCLYRIGQQVIERTTEGGRHVDRTVVVVKASPRRVVTTSGLSYTGLGVSDLEPPVGYRSIRDIAYPTASKAAAESGGAS